VAVVFHIPGYLLPFTARRSRVELEGSPGTVGEALEALFQAHPGVRDRLVDELGRVRLHLNVFAGTESIRYTGGLATPLANGSEISIVPAVSGG